MNNTERQLILDLMAKAQAVINSIDPSEIVDGVDEDTTYEVNAHAIWELGTAIGVIERDLGADLSNELEPVEASESIRERYYNDYLKRRRGDRT